MAPLFLCSVLGRAVRESSKNLKVNFKKNTVGPAENEKGHEIWFISPSFFFCPC